MRRIILRLVAIIALLAALLNMLFRALRVYSDSIFWIIIIILALIAFPGMKWLARRTDGK